MILLIAVDPNFAIGKDGDLLYHISDDLKNFRKLTEGQIIVMGRKTLEALPGGKPLPHRENVVLTRGKLQGGENLHVAHNEEELLALLQSMDPAGEKKVYLIGGGGVTRALYHLVDEAIITYYNSTFEEADTWIPDLDEDPSFILVDETKPREYEGETWTIRTYRRKAEEA